MKMQETEQAFVAEFLLVRWGLPYRQRSRSDVCSRRRTSAVESREGRASLPRSSKGVAALHQSSCVTDIEPMMALRSAAMSEQVRHYVPQGTFLQGADCLVFVSFELPLLCRSR